MQCNIVIFLHNIGLTSLSSITFRDNNIYTLCDVVVIIWDYMFTLLYYVYTGC